MLTHSIDCVKELSESSSRFTDVLFLGMIPGSLADVNNRNVKSCIPGCDDISFKGSKIKQLKERDQGFKRRQTKRVRINPEVKTV